MVIGLAVDDLLALIANGMVGGQVLVDGCYVLRVRHSVMVDGLVGDRPVVGVRLLFALRAVLRRRIGTAFLGIIRLHGFGLGTCAGWVADAVIGTAADERDESKRPQMAAMTFRLCGFFSLSGSACMLFPSAGDSVGISVVHLDIVLFIVLHGCIPFQIKRKAGCRKSWHPAGFRRYGH